MTYPHPKLQGKSFLWAFGVCFFLFTGSTFWGKTVGINRDWAAVMMAASGFVPLLVTLGTGYALDGAWVAKYSCTQHPIRFGIGLLICVGLAGYFTYHALGTLSPVPAS